jgi:hypothetical protein
VARLLDVTDVGHIVTAMRSLAADLVTERERVRSLLRENRELQERLESAQLESAVCPHCGLSVHGAGVGTREGSSQPRLVSEAVKTI